MGKTWELVKKQRSLENIGTLNRKVLSVSSLNDYSGGRLLACCTAPPFSVPEKNSVSENKSFSDRVWKGSGDTYWFGSDRFFD